jgi:hypothetical protein
VVEHSTSLFLVAVADGDDPDRRCLRDSRVSDLRGWGWLAPQLGLQFGPRLRAHAYATGRSATDVARDILDRRLRLDAD